MPTRKRVGTKRGELIKKVRKPVPPPTRVEEDTTKYRRARERERMRREREKEQGGETSAQAPTQGARSSDAAGRKTNHDRRG